jgi:biopolymer transport protein TolQ
MPILTAALLTILQADGGAAPASEPLPEVPTAVAQLMHNIGPVAIGVLVLLLIASFYSWTVIFGKMSTFSRATGDTRRFLKGFRNASRLQEISTLAADCPRSPLAQVFEDVYETYKRQTGGAGPPRNMTSLERSAQTAASEAVTALERRMTWLATIASTTVYVGLFGTVIGVMDSFLGLGTAGAATLRAVAPGISEALITTAAGLFVAVPAVVAFNQFTARIRVFAAAIDDFCRELLNSLEEIPVRAAAPVRAPGAEIPREAERGVHQ